ncbi:MAG: DMT family transporter [Candidatus Melainabacteria bacterium]|nr:DMT family transporter [Candidatus Melainabacteria bacterium]
MSQNIRNNKTFLADLGLLYASAVWGTTFFIVKGVVKHIDPVILCAYRFLLAAIIVSIFLLITKRQLFSNLKEGFVLGFFLWAIYISQTIGLVFTSAANAAFITGLFVAFIPIFSFVFFRIMPSLIQIIAIFIALIGLWLLTGGLNSINKGDLITIITAIAYALHVLFGDKFVKNNIDPFVLCFQQFLFVSIFSFITAFFFKLDFAFSTENVFWIIIYLTLFPTVLAFLIQLIAQKITSPIKVSLIFALEPLFGAVFAWTFGKEAFILNSAFGGLLILLAIVISDLEIDLRKLFLKVTTM